MTLKKIGSGASSGTTPKVDQQTTTQVQTPPASSPSDDPKFSASPPDRPALVPSGPENKGLTTATAAPHPSVQADTQPTSAWRERVSEFVGNWKAEEKKGPLKGIISGATGEGSGVTELVKSNKEASPLAAQMVANAGLGIRHAVGVSRAIVNPLTSVSDKVATALKDGKPVDSWLKVSGVPVSIGQGFNSGLAALSLINSAKTGVELVRDFAGDVAASRDRTALSHLLKDYDINTHTLKDSKGEFTIPATTYTMVDGAEKAIDHPTYAHIKELMNAKGADRSRTQGQAVCDRLTQLKDITISNSQAANGILSTVGKTAVKAALGDSISKAVPGVGAAVTFVAAGHATWKAAVNISALNNVRLAEDNAKDDLWLKAISSHIKQERLHNSRTNLANAAANAVSGSLQTASLAAGPGAPAALVVAGLCGTALTVGVAIGVTAFEIGHKATLAKRREGAEGKLKDFQTQLQQDGADKAKLMASLSDGSNIGLAEFALMKRLRSSEPKERAAAVKFLTDFGLSKNTIIKLQTKDMKSAMDAMQNALYSEKVNLSWKGLSYTVGSVGRVLGIVQAVNAAKKGLTFLADKITESVTPRQGSGIELVGASNVRGGLKSPPKFSLEETRSAFKLQGAPSTSSHVRDSHRTGVHSRVNEELNAVIKRNSVLDLPQVRSLAQDADELDNAYRADATA
ncbi:hypothetical protein [Limnohabitans sp. 2KL-3]|uniref:hypothetical protein n=1 Tax=Limnohabitans sp. 2KL-3 TaxID=1100700 RepID=UPI000B0AEF99|nr:hypothetical protein [Limnohabitans sp. 2KL-3]